jgi:hypothetical protein
MKKTDAAGSGFGSDVKISDGSLDLLITFFENFDVNDQKIKYQAVGDQPFNGMMHRYGMLGPE